MYLIVYIFKEFLSVLHSSNRLLFNPLNLHSCSKGRLRWKYYIFTRIAEILLLTVGRCLGSYNFISLKITFIFSWMSEVWITSFLYYLSLLPNGCLFLLLWFIQLLSESIKLFYIFLECAFDKKPCIVYILAERLLFLLET